MNATKGSFYILISNIAFVLSGYAIYFGLARMLGPGLYGDYGVVVSLVSTINTVLAISMQQAVSKFVSEDVSKALSVRNKALKMQCLIVFVAFTVYILLSGHIANVFNDPRLTPFIQLSAFIIPFQGLYAVYLGYFNGLQEFGKQAKVSILYYIVKLVLVLSMVFLGYSLFGAIAGLALASFAALAVAASVTGFRKIEKSFSGRKILSFGYPVALFALMINLILTIDILFLKALLPVSIASIKVGFYTAALYIARIPYFIVDAIAVVIFPIISANLAVGRLEDARNYIRKTFRYVLLLISFTTLAIISISEPLVRWFYTDAYIEAAQPLFFLVFGLACFSVFAVATAVISGSGRPKASLIISFLVVSLQVSLLYFLIPEYGIVGAAMATTLAMAFGSVIASGYVYKKFNALIDRSSLFKITASFFLSSLLLSTRLAFFTSITYLILLIVFREFKRDDIILIKRLFSSG